MFLIEMNHYLYTHQLIKVNKCLIYMLLNLSEYILNTESKRSK